ncbi:hypothetical protein [Haloferax marisrubri]|nr:hypothetical protein [Haloferax marisrubri]
MGTSEQSYFKCWICRKKMLWTSVLSFTLLIVVLGLLAMTGIERGTASYVVLMMDFALAGILLVTVGVVFWRCGYLSDALD